MNGLKLYADTLSPVCRSVMSFMALNNIPYTMENVSLGNSKFMKLAVCTQWSYYTVNVVMHNARLFIFLSFSSDTNTKTYADTESLAPNALKFRSGRKIEQLCMHPIKINRTIYALDLDV